MPSDQERFVARYVAERVRALRKGKGWTQAQLADAAELNQSTISRVESGRRLENLFSLTMVASALGSSLHHLLPPHLPPTPHPSV